MNIKQRLIDKSFYASEQVIIVEKTGDMKYQEAKVIRLSDALQAIHEANETIKVLSKEKAELQDEVYNLKMFRDVLLDMCAERKTKMTICTHCNKVCESADVCYQCGNSNGLSDVQDIPSCSYCKSLTQITTASDCCGEETKEVNEEERKN